MSKVFSSLVIVFAVSMQIWGQCGGFFKETSRQVLSNGFTYEYFEDFDNDGKNDLLGYSLTQIGYGAPNSFQLHYYKRTSANSFDPAAKSTALTNVSNYGTFAVIGDVNGDGFKDLIVKHQTNPVTLTTYQNDGTGKFLPSANSTVIPGGEVARAATDLNGDGKADLVTNLDGVLSYRLAQSDNTFAAPVTISAGNPTMDTASNVGNWIDTFPLLVEDLNGDNLKDIAFTVRSGSSYWDYKLYVLTNSGNLSFTQTALVPFGAAVTRLRTYDLNNDGKKDFISEPTQNNPSWIAVNNGTNGFTSTNLSIISSSINSYGETYNTRKFAAADFDNDGDTDIIYPGTKYYTLVRNHGSLTFSYEQMKAVSGIEEIANLDNDGRADGIFINYRLLDGLYTLYDGNNYYDYYSRNSVSFRKNVCNRAGQTKIIDFDGDGYVDRAFWNSQTGMWRYYASSEGFFANQYFTTLLGASNPTDVPVPNDYDGDGITDHAVYRKSSGNWSIKGSSGQNVYDFNFGISEDKPVPADYDGDGRADIAVYRPSTGVWHFWLSQTSQYHAVQFGIAEDKVVPSDYDGDGKADIAVWRPSTQVWYVLKSSDGSFFAIQYGLGTDKPVPGDYDGDGKANVAIYRNGVWYVLKSDYTNANIYWGIAGDVPFINESIYRPTVGVYRASNSSFHLGVPGQRYAYADPTGNAANEIFVSSILPPQ